MIPSYLRQHTAQRQIASTRVKSASEKTNDLVKRKVSLLGKVGAELEQRLPPMPKKLYTKVTKSPLVQAAAPIIIGAAKEWAAAKSVGGPAVKSPLRAGMKVTKETVKRGLLPHRGESDEVYQKRVAKTASQGIRMINQMRKQPLGQAALAEAKKVTSGVKLPDLVASSANKTAAIATIVVGILGVLALGVLVGVHTLPPLAASFGVAGILLASVITISLAAKPYKKQANFFKEVRTTLHDTTKFANKLSQFERLSEKEANKLIENFVTKSFAKLVELGKEHGMQEWQVKLLEGQCKSALFAYLKSDKSQDIKEKCKALALFMKKEILGKELAKVAGVKVTLDRLLMMLSTESTYLYGSSALWAVSKAVKGYAAKEMKKLSKMAETDSARFADHVGAMTGRAAVTVRKKLREVEEQVKAKGKEVLEQVAAEGVRVKDQGVGALVKAATHIREREEVQQAVAIMGAIKAVGEKLVELRDEEQRSTLAGPDLPVD